MTGQKTPKRVIQKVPERVIQKAPKRVIRKAPEPAMMRAGLARATGCNLETIRYYETIGVMPPPPRTAAGARLYDARHVARLRFVMRMRELGFTLAQVRGFLALVDGGTQTCAQVQARTERHLLDIRAKIADLQRIENVLAETAARCSGLDVPECPIIDRLFAPA